MHPRDCRAPETELVQEACTISKTLLWLVSVLNLHTFPTRVRGSPEPPLHRGDAGLHSDPFLKPLWVAR